MTPLTIKRLSLCKNAEEIQKCDEAFQKPAEYKTDEKGYIDFAAGLFVRNRYIIIDTMGRGLSILLNMTHIRIIWLCAF